MQKLKHMTRPVHFEKSLRHSAKDQKLEDAVRKEIEETWKIECRVFGGETNPFDFYCCDGKDLLCIGEIKDHYLPQSDLRRSKLFAVRKWLNLVTAASALGVPAYFVVKFADGVFYVHVDSLTPRSWRCSIAGRSDRNLQNDIEPCLWIPNHEFMPLTELPYGH